MSFAIRATKAVAHSMDTMRTIQAADMMAFSVLGIQMMTLQEKCTPITQADVNKITMDSLKTNAAARSVAVQTDHLQYKTDNALMDKSTGEFRSFLDGQKNQVTQDTGNQKNLIRLQNEITGAMATLTNIIKLAVRYGK